MTAVDVALLATLSLGVYYLTCIETVIQKLLPVISIILTAVGAPEVGPIIQLVVGVLEVVHQFC